MAETDFILRFIYLQNTPDIRTFRVYEVVGGSFGMELYRFYHPMTGSTTGATTFHRQNSATLVFENAGSIEWTSNTNATVYFGMDEVPVRQLRRLRNPSSTSRRFRVGSSEYRWKIAENEVDLFCLDTWGNTVASWSQENATLRIALHCLPILDRMVVSCMMNLWFKQLGQW